MKTLLRLAALSSLLLTGCSQQPPATTNQPGGDQAFKKVHDEYVVEFLRRNPTVNTYLGGAGLDSKLRDGDGALRDHSAAAMHAEDRWLGKSKQALDAINPTPLSAPQPTNPDVGVAQ